MSEQNKLIQIFDALGDKTRFNLLRILAERDEICVSELASEVNISTAGASQQLKVLEKVGLIIRNRKGQKICYAVNKNSQANQKLLEIINE